jgi:hypothetical protein
VSLAVRRPPQVAGCRCPARRGRPGLPGGPALRRVGPGRRHDGGGVSPVCSRPARSWSRSLGRRESALDHCRPELVHHDPMAAARNAQGRRGARVESPVTPVLGSGRRPPGRRIPNGWTCSTAPRTSRSRAVGPRCRPAPAPAGRVSGPAGSSRRLLRSPGRQAPPRRRRRRGRPTRFPGGHRPRSPLVDRGRARQALRSAGLGCCRGHVRVVVAAEATPDGVVAVVRTASAPLSAVAGATG